MELRIHPTRLLDADDWACLEIFNAWHTAGALVSAPGPLPFAGGYADQPAALMRGLHHMAGVASKLKPPPKPDKGGTE